MKQIIYLFLSAFLISFFGSIPLGTLNITIANLSIQQNNHALIKFAIGAILIELLIVKLSMHIIIQLEKIKSFILIFKRISILVIFLLSIFFLVIAIENKPINNKITFRTEDALFWGILLSLLNPLHLPFWMGWTTFLKSKGLLNQTLIIQIVYLIAIALGTGLAFYLYKALGVFLIQVLRDNNNAINYIIGFSLLFVGVNQLFKIRNKNYS